MQAAEVGLVDRAVTTLCRVVLWLSMAVIFVILVVNTVLRYVTGSSLQWANEVPELLFPWLVMSGVVIAAQSGAPIATTFLMEALPAAGRRKRLHQEGGRDVSAALCGDDHTRHHQPRE